MLGALECRGGDHPLHMGLGAVEHRPIAEPEAIEEPSPHQPEGIFPALGIRIGRSQGEALHVGSHAVRQAEPPPGVGKVVRAAAGPTERPPGDRCRRVDGGRRHAAISPKGGGPDIVARAGAMERQVDDQLFRRRPAKGPAGTPNLHRSQHRHLDLRSRVGTRRRLSVDGPRRGGHGSERSAHPGAGTDRSSSGQRECFPP